MVAPAGKEGGWKRWRRRTGCSERGAARDEREMTGINGRYADTRNSIDYKRSRNRNINGEIKKNLKNNKKYKMQKI